MGRRAMNIREVLAGKATHRRKLAQLPIGEKLRLLDAMRARAIAIRATRIDPPAIPNRVAEDSSTYRAGRKRKK